MYRIAQIKSGSPAVEEASSLKDLKLGEGIIWVDMIAKTEKELAEVKDFFGFHPLSIEDCVSRMQRSKVDIYEDYLLIIMKNPDLKSRVVVNQVAMFINKNYIVTISNTPMAEVESTMKKVQLEKNIKGLTPDFIAYMITDLIVDSYFPILAGIEERMESLEKIILEDPTKKDITPKIFSIKRCLLSLRKSMWPSREVLNTLSKETLDSISAKNRMYYRDVYDHVVVIIDLVETYRDILSGILDIYLSSISNNMNQVMKVLTVIATIFMPLTFVTGLYGMNFRGGGLNMPELYWSYGYVAVLLLMFFISVGMIYYFKKKRWI